MSRLLVSLILALLLLPLPALAKSFKIATIAPEGSMWMTEMRAGAAEIEQRTAGRVKLRFYPGGIMGNDSSVLRKIRIGQLQGGAFTGGGLADIYPDSQVYSLPFIFRSYAEVDYVRARMDAVVIDGLRQQGFISFGLGEGGFAYLMANHSITTVGDLSGHKVWIPEGDAISRTGFNAIGVSPVSLPLADVLTGLQTGLIDTVATTPVAAIALQWHTRVKYVNDAPLLYVIGTLLIQRQAFERLAPGDQQIMSEVMRATFARINTQSREDNQKARQALSTQGIQFLHSSEEEHRQWTAPVTHAMDRLAHEGVFSAPILQMLRNHLNDYRKGAGEPAQ